MRLIVCILAAWVSVVQGITLQWDPAIDDPLVAGYEVHYGTASGIYDSVVSADENGAATDTAELLGISPGTYYFAVRSKSADGTLYSTFSNEVHYGNNPQTIPVDPVGGRWSYQQLETPLMATVTKTVAASGADYTTVAGALGWFQSNHDFDTDGIAQILITDTSTYTQSSTLTLNGIAGTPSASAYLEITSNAANPFAGPIINMTHGSNGGYEFDIEYIRVTNLRFHLNNTNASTECIRISSNGDHFLIDRNVFIALQQTSQQDGIYAGAWSVEGTVGINVLIGFARAAIHPQIYIGVGATQTWNIESNTIADYHIVNETDGGGVSVNRSGTNTYNINAYNNLIYNHSGESDSNNWNEFSSSSTVNYTGSNNITEDASAEDKFTSSYDSVVFTESEPSSGENAWLTEIDNTDETLINLAIVGENAYTKTGNGVNRAGSEPDSRLDLSTDIMGNSRHATTPDIGAFELIEAGATLVDLASEADTALSISAAKLATMGQPAEGNQALAVTSQKLSAVGLSVSTGSVFDITSAKQVTFGLALEADLSLDVGTSTFVTAGVSTETDLSRDVVPARAVTAGLGAEADASIEIGTKKASVIGLSAETNEALAAIAAGAITIGISEELGSALSPSAIKNALLGLPQETSTAQTVAAVLQQLIAVSTANETVAALAIGHAKQSGVGLSAEADQATILAIPQSIVIGQSVETGQALSAAPDRALSVLQGVEVDAGLAVDWSRSVNPGFALEAGSAFAVVIEGALVVYAEGLQFTVPENRIHYTL